MIIWLNEEPPHTFNITKTLGRAWWQAEIRRIKVQSQTKQIVCETLSWKSPSQKRAGGVAPGVGPEFQP
jgi:hypothetical protein